MVHVVTLKQSYKLSVLYVSGDDNVLFSLI